jgi:pyridoxal phosphate enzyme (YggS family)
MCARWSACSAGGARLQSGAMTYDALPRRLAEVRDRIAAACARAGRNPDEVGLVAVTKTHPAPAVDAALMAGLGDIGENRVQELESKVGEVGRSRARWHLIGGLQRNKVRRALPLFDLLHSLDSERLAVKISDEAREAGVTVCALVQVNPSGEESKSGFAPDDLVPALARICELPGIRVEGLMTMAPFTADQSTLREVFGRARSLRETAAREVPGFHGLHLSMGMSNDYEVAVEEGSTLVRLGTVLFGEREP